MSNPIFFPKILIIQGRRQKFQSTGFLFLKDHIFSQNLKLPLHGLVKSNSSLAKFLEFTGSLELMEPVTMLILVRIVPYKIYLMNLVT